MYLIRASVGAQALFLPIRRRILEVKKRRKMFIIPSSPSPLYIRMYGSCLAFLSRKYFSTFFPRRLASHCAYERFVRRRRSQQLILFVLQISSNLTTAAFKLQDQHEMYQVRPFIMQDFFRFKDGPFLPVLFVTSFLIFLVRV